MTEPLPCTVGFACRTLLNLWARLDRAPGWRYRIIEEWGERFADRPIVGRLPNGCSILCDLRDAVQRHIYFWGVFEPCEAWLFTQLLKPGMTVVDAGANVGQYTLLASKCVGGTGMVHAFEPVPSVFERLNHHVLWNKVLNIKLNRAALWSEDLSSISLGVPEGQACNVSRYTIAANAEVSAPAVTLDTYADLSSLKRLDFVKMDIEGAEPYAIAGANNVLTTFAPLVLMELAPALLLKLGNRASRLVEMMHDLGYRSWRIGPSAEASGELENPDKIDIANVLFYHDDLPGCVRDGWSYRQAIRWARSGW